jgi:ubiquinone/menaquinone biosynthesis C-methylase UbiE
MTEAAASSTFVAGSGDGYERVMGRWSRRLAPLFIDFAGTAAGERVLDVGCGTGHLAFALAERGVASEIRAIDLAAPYVEHARQRNTHRHVTFDVGDACALPYPDAAFDRVLSMLMLHFVPKTHEAIAQMRRVARPGAVVAATVWDARGGYVANRVFWDTAAAVDPDANARRARNYTRPMTRPGELGEAWRRAGFTEVAETSLVIRMEFAAFDDYWGPYVGGDGPGAEYVRTLDEPRIARLKEALRAAYLDGEDDGPRSYAGLAWAVRGVAPR